MTAVDDCDCKEQENVGSHVVDDAIANIIDVGTLLLTCAKRLQGDGGAAVMLPPVRRRRE